MTNVGDFEQLNIVRILPNASENVGPNVIGILPNAGDNAGSNVVRILLNARESVGGIVVGILSNVDINLGSWHVFGILSTVGDIARRNIVVIQQLSKTLVHNLKRLQINK